MKKATIICVDDDQGLQTVVSHYLEEQGYKVLSAYSGKELESTMLTENADAILLDLVLPDSEGLDLIRKIRDKSNVPIIVVSGRSDTTEKIVGLEMGADDYMTKPFAMRELSARLRAVMRRAANESTGVSGDTNKKDTSKIKFGSWLLDRTQYQVFDQNNNPLELTIGEFRLLEALLISANRTLSREHLFEATREGTFDAYDRAIDIQIARIRKKLNDDPSMIKTVRGVGYMYVGNIELLP